MDIIKAIVDKGWEVSILKEEKRYFVRVYIQFDEDSFDEYDTPCFKTIEEALHIAYGYVCV